MGKAIDLTYDEVRRYLTFLPDEAIDELVKGPLPDLEPGDAGYEDADDCRVCRALMPLTSSGPANALLEFHDFVARSLDLTRAAVKDGHNSPVVREMLEIIGGLSYARCGLIYALADVEKWRRGVEPQTHREFVEQRRPTV